MKPEENEISRSKGRCAAAGVFLLGGLVFTACSGEKEEKVRFAKPAATKPAEANESAAAENQTDFIMESYLAPEERLKRRQGRITSILDTALPPAESASTPAP